jgi:hypothetical protein
MRAETCARVHTYTRALSLSHSLTHTHTHTCIGHTHMQGAEHTVSHVFLFLVQGTNILYKASMEPQRFLLHLGRLCQCCVE